MQDILSIYSSFVSGLLSIQIPGVGITVGSFWLGTVFLLMGSHVLRWIFGVNFHGLAPSLEDRVKLKSIKRIEARRMQKQQERFAKKQKQR